MQAETENAMSPVCADFLTFVRNLIPEDKFKIFQSLFRFPVATNDVCKVIFERLYQVFDGRNKNFSYSFKNLETAADWEAYRTNVLKEPLVWETKGWEKFKSDINSIMVVDMPTDANTPYFYFLSLQNVLDITTADGVILKLVFKQDEDKCFVLDSERYALFSLKDNKPFNLISEKPHNLGYCPARFFWCYNLNSKSDIVKHSPLSEVLDDLDWYLFFLLSKRQLDLYGAYPIYSGYEQECDFKTDNGDFCDGGFLRDSKGRYLYDVNGLLQRCPRCGNKRIAGVGSFVEIPIPTDGQPDLRNPVQILSIDKNSLDFNVAELERQKQNIINSVCGTDEILTKEAVNDSQVKAVFTSQNRILNNIKKGFESAQKWVDDTICRLRYGDDFLSSSISYGTDFFLDTEDELRARYQTAKENGATLSELSALQNKIIETEYKTNSVELERQQLLKELEPLPNLTIQEVTTLFEKGLITPETAKMKIFFNDLISRFERENTNILDFGVLDQKNNKINTIKKTLIGYLAEM